MTDAERIARLEEAFIALDARIAAPSASGMPKDDELTELEERIERLEQRILALLHRLGVVDPTTGKPLEDADYSGKNIVADVDL